MKKLHFLLFIAFISISIISQAQFTISGKVTDAETKEPLLGASVFCQNTTIGRTTNKEGGFELSLKQGGYDLIITYTGYQTKLVRINTNENIKLEVELSKEDKSLGEVVIKNSYEVLDGWEKYGKFFTSHFIGATPFAAQCSLQNHEVLKFYYYKRSNRLKVLALEPLRISNKALGYNLNYNLDSFVYYYKNDLNSYRGYCLYTAMEGTEAEMKKWNANREKAYFGSRIHFMRAYYDSTIDEEGFMIQMLDEVNNKKFTSISNPYDTTYFLPADSTNEIEIFYPRKISITYQKRAPETEYLNQYKLPKNIGFQTTYVDLLDAVAIKLNGYYYDQKDWVNQGYWSWKNLADQVPYDYNP
jgi:hypothetical protein